MGPVDSGVASQPEWLKSVNRVTPYMFLASPVVGGAVNAYNRNRLHGWKPTVVLAAPFTLTLLGLCAVDYWKDHTCRPVDQEYSKEPLKTHKWDK